MLDRWRNTLQLLSCTVCGRTAAPMHGWDMRTHRGACWLAGWWGQTKAVSSIFMGSTPEFELALYTMCFLGGGEENVVWLDDFQVLIKAYRIRSNKGGEIGALP
jgi:Endoribonuclease XendoU